MDTHRKIFRTIVLFIVSVFSVLISCDEQETRDAEIKNISKDTLSVPAPDHFFFVGKYRGKESLYKYDLKENKYNVFWFGEKEKVIELLTSANNEFAFFITARRMGMKQGISFIKGVKLYWLYPLTSSIELTGKIDEVVQLYAQWDDKNFKLQFTHFDFTIATQIDMVSRIYSRFGKFLDEKTGKYDIIKEGYPLFQKKNIKLISPSGKFGINIKNDSLFLKLAGEKSNIFIDSTDQTIKKIKWIRNKRYAIFSTKKSDLDDQSNKQQSYYYVFDIIKKKSIARLNGNGNINFIIINNLLIYDDGLQSNSSIIIYDLEKLSIIKKIKLYGGCSLVSLNI